MASVNTNIGALVAQGNMNKTERDMAQAMERLSSGLRLNSASDDAAGVSISSRMEGQIRGLSQAVRNSEDAKNLIDTVEGASQEIVAILQRLRELAVQSATDTLSPLDRTFLKDEATALIAEIDRIKDTTAYNGSKVLDGTYASKVFQVGHKATEEIGVTVQNMASSAIGTFQLIGDSVSDIVTDSTSDVVTTALVINGHLGAGTTSLASAASAKAAAEGINGLTSSTGVTARAVSFAKIDTLSAAGTFNFNLTGDASADIATVVADTSDLTVVRDAINDVAAITGITASYFNGEQDKLKLTHSTGETMKFTNIAGVASTTEVNIRSLNNDGSTNVSGSAVVTMDGTNDVIMTGTVIAESVKAFTISGDNATADLGFFGTVASNTGATTTGGTASISNIANIDIGTHNGAETAIAVIDGAIDMVNLERSNLGAISNRLDKTINNLSNIVENTTASRSNINDANFAAETTQLTKSQILNQAATSMLAQANASKQNLLALIQN